MSGIVRTLVPAFPRFAVTATASDRALAPGELAQLVAEELEREGRAPDGLLSVYDTVADALDTLTEAGEPVVAAGTITLAGEVAGLLRRR